MAFPFLEPELASIIAVTDGINFNSILYQWLPYISAIFIIGGLVLVLLKYYRRHIDLVIYYNSIISSLNFFKVLFKDELDSDLGFGDSISDYKEKIILGFAETQNPSYVFEHVLATKKNKCCREEGGNIEQILATLGKTVDGFKEEISRHNYDSFKKGGLGEDGKTKPTIAFILPVTEDKLDVAKEMYCGFLCFKHYKHSNKKDPNYKEDLLKCLSNPYSDSNIIIIKETPFNVLIENDKNDPTESIYLAEKLVKNKNIIAVVGHNSGLSSIIASKTYKKHEIPIILPTADGTMVSGQDSNVMQMLPLTDDTTDYFVKFINDYYHRDYTKERFEICKDTETKTGSVCYTIKLLVCHDSGFDSASAILSFYSPLESKIQKLNKSNDDLKIELVDNDICTLDKEQKIVPISFDKYEDIDGVIAVSDSGKIEKYLELLQDAGAKRSIFVHPSFLTKAALERTELKELKLYTVSPFYNKGDYIPWRTAMVYDTFLALEKPMRIL